MNALFYISGLVAIICALMVITRANAAHALVYLVILFLAIASVFLTLGAPLVAVLQIVIYAGAIIVLFVFVVMMLNLGRAAEQREGTWLRWRTWIIPAVLGLVLLVQIGSALAGRWIGTSGAQVGPKSVGVSLFTDYLIGVELASMMLLAALAAAFHYGDFASRQEGQDD